MAVSDLRFASEILLENGECLKFDDLSCLQDYRETNPDSKIRATYVKDYDTKEWLPWDRATIAQTGMHTPMGSGLVAVSTASRAAELTAQHPVEQSK